MGLLTEIYVNVEGVMSCKYFILPTKELENFIDLVLKPCLVHSLQNLKITFKNFKFVSEFEALNVQKQKCNSSSLIIRDLHNLCHICFSNFHCILRAFSFHFPSIFHQIESFQVVQVSLQTLNCNNWRWLTWMLKSARRNWHPFPTCQAFFSRVNQNFWKGFRLLPSRFYFLKVICLQIVARRGCTGKLLKYLYKPPLFARAITNLWALPLHSGTEFVDFLVNATMSWTECYHNKLDSN